MPPLTHVCRLFIFTSSLIVVTGVSSRADDADTIKERLFQSKKVYDVEVQKFKKSISDLLDKREDLARTLGDKKQLDEVKAQRKAFEEAGEPPTGLPVAVTTQIRSARATLDKAYQTTVRDSIKSKQDTAADVAEKERQHFLVSSAFLFGKRTSLSSLKAFNIATYNNTFVADAKHTRDGEIVPHCVFLHPPARGDSKASYPLAGKWVGLRVTVGVPLSVENGAKISSPLTFEILGDGKSLWTSEPVSKFDMFQTCEVNVEKVKILTLRVGCPEHNGWAQAVWFRPTLVE